MPPNKLISLFYSEFFIDEPDGNTPRRQKRRDQIKLASLVLFSLRKKAAKKPDQIKLASLVLFSLRIIIKKKR